MQQLAIKSAQKPVAKDDITDRIKSVDDAFRELGITGDVITATVHDALAKFVKPIGRFVEIVALTAALNEGWEPNWSDSKQTKWVLYFDMRNGGFVLYNVDVSYQLSSVPSCLCFKNERLARHAFKICPDLYKDFITNQ